MDDPGEQRVINISTKSFLPSAAVIKRGKKGFKRQVDKNLNQSLVVTKASHESSHSTFVE